MAEVAPAYVFLASDEASYVSDARIAVTGGNPICKPGRPERIARRAAKRSILDRRFSKRSLCGPGFGAAPFGMKILGPNGAVCLPR